MGMLCLQDYNHCRGEKCPKFESIKDKQVPVKCKVKVKKNNLGKIKK